MYFLPVFCFRFIWIFLYGILIFLRTCFANLFHCLPFINSMADWNSRNLLISTFLILYPLVTYITLLGYFICTDFILMLHKYKCQLINKYNYKSIFLLTKTVWTNTYAFPTQCCMVLVLFSGWLYLLCIEWPAQSLICGTHYTNYCFATSYHVSVIL